jgi:hypothetical protein
MPTCFIDGPAEGVKLSLSRAPKYLRVVMKNIICGRGVSKWDALDKLDDKPDPNETIYAYCMTKTGITGRGFVDGRDPKTGKRWGHSFESANYEFVPDQPPDEVLRDNVKWAEWVHATHAQKSTAPAAASPVEPPPS